VQARGASSFGDDRVLIEKYLVRPRHIEIQVFGDTQGNCVYLFERDCSVQRRHQKVLEEAPAPGMTPERRAAMGRPRWRRPRPSATSAPARWSSSPSRTATFYFMEMNTRLQVEHPVTEMITGLDLVEWQLRVAAGEPLPLAQEQLAIRGHALEARIYAEDPDKGFLPSTGRLIHLAPPAESLNVRIDTGVEEGDEITPHYDPMIAKLIVWDADRERALARMLQSLAQYRVVGVSSNVDFLSRLVACPAFANADLDTGLIERERAFLFPEGVEAPAEVFLVAALAELLREEEAARTAAAPRPRPAFALAPARRLAPQRLAPPRRCCSATARPRRPSPSAMSAAATRWNSTASATAARGERTGNSMLRIELGGMRLPATVIAAGEKRHVFLHGRAWQLACVDPLYHAGEGVGEPAAGWPRRCRAR
jgi:3-methylcrotonyl-CoA carboxylase alpha subunit